MGVMINLYCNKEVVNPDEVATLVVAMQSIAREVLDKKDIFAFASETSNLLSDDPVEVFVQVNSIKVTDVSDLADLLGAAISAWRRDVDFPHPINLNVVPLEWHPRLGL